MFVCMYVCYKNLSWKVIELMKIPSWSGHNNGMYMYIDTYVDSLKILIRVAFFYSLVDKDKEYLNCRKQDKETSKISWN